MLCLLSACERPQVTAVPHGPPGSGMALLSRPGAQPAEAAPEIAPPARARADAPKVGDVYRNVQVLGALGIGEFGRTMNAMAEWVSPAQGCAHCHVDGDLASDAKYTKVVARRMLQMVRHLNAEASAHVGATGVTCYTCHRGSPLPAQAWFRQPRPRTAASALGLAALQPGAFSAYLLANDDPVPIRVTATTALPSGHRVSIQQTEATYALMLHMAQALGVNCSFCHNSRSFASWAESAPQRVTAWQGIRMVRDINTAFLEPLAGTFAAAPGGRLGAAGDTAKVSCATCHRGHAKPLDGAQTARHYPALWGDAPAPEPTR